MITKTRSKATRSNMEPLDAQAVFEEEESSKEDAQDNTEEEQEYIRGGNKISTTGASYFIS